MDKGLGPAEGEGEGRERAPRRVSRPWRLPCCLLPPSGPLCESPAQPTPGPVKLDSRGLRPPQLESPGSDWALRFLSWEGIGPAGLGAGALPDLAGLSPGMDSRAQNPLFSPQRPAAGEISKDSSVKSVEPSSALVQGGQARAPRQLLSWHGASGQGQPATPLDKPGFS